MACSAPMRVPAERSQAEPRAADLVVAKLDCGALAVAQSLALLVDAERERADRFLIERERRRFIVARATLRRLLGERLGISPLSVRLAYGKHGKPALAKPLSESGLRFNVSHCEDTAVYAFAFEREIGVDVEALREIEDAESIAQRFFSPGESRALLSLAASARPLAFFRCWTRKEAFIKAVGDGLSYPLDQFEVSLLPGEPARLVHVRNCPGERSGWELRAFEPGQGFVGAVAVQAS